MKAVPALRRVNFLHSTLLGVSFVRPIAIISVPPHLSFHLPFLSSPTSSTIRRSTSQQRVTGGEEREEEEGGGLIIQMFTVAFKDKLIKACTRTRANIRDRLEIMRVHTQHARAHVLYNMRA